MSVVLILLGGVFSSPLEESDNRGILSKVGDFFLSSAQASPAGARQLIGLNAGKDIRTLTHFHSLNESIQDPVVNVLRKLEEAGWQPVIAEGKRTKAQQREKVRKGFSKTMNSRHLTGSAVDIIDKRYGWGGPASDTSFQFWNDLGKFSKEEGLFWGGDWKSFKDVAHVQVRGKK